MSDASTPRQAAEPDEAIAAADQGQLHTPPNPGGSALLDANAAAGETTDPKGDILNYPAASNFSGANAPGDDKTAASAAIAGPYSAEQSQPAKGRVNLHNNPDVPDNSTQGAIPDTDQTKLPIDPAVNHPD